MRQGSAGSAQSRLRQKGANVQVGGVKIGTADSASDGVVPTKRKSDQVGTKTDKVTDLRDVGLGVGTGDGTARRSRGSDTELETR